MDSDQIIIPDGWTYFAHRTNTVMWSEDPFNMDMILVKKIMSVVTESDVHDELRHYGKNHLQAYSLGQGEEFEIRCLICDLSYLRTLDGDIKDIMYNEFYYDRRNFGGCYGQRHHSIPPKEELIVLGIGEHDEVFDTDKKIIWTIPKRLLEFYKEELKKNKNRSISLKKKEDIKTK